MVIEYACASADERWIAREMGIAIGTVKNHKVRAFGHLGFSRVIELILRKQEERVETNKFVVIGKYEDGADTVIVSREITAPTKEIAETIFKMALEGEGMGTPIIETSYGPYAK